MCGHWIRTLFYKKKKKEYYRESKNYIYYGEETNYIIKKPRPPTPSPIYTPGCLSRPIKYAKLCSNCGALFYKYEKDCFCSNECKMSFAYSNRTRSLSC